MKLRDNVVLVPIVKVLNYYIIPCTYLKLSPVIVSSLPQLHAMCSKNVNPFYIAPLSCMSQGPVKCMCGVGWK